MLKEKFGNDIRVSRDCELLTLDIESVTGEHLGVNSMKRLLGFIDDERNTRQSTLDVISRYLGYPDWDTLRLQDESSSNSTFDDRDEYLACNFEKGQRLVVTYPHNREITMEYVGENHFSVIESKNSKLLKGDLLTLTHIVRGYPLLVSEVIRDGENMGSYTAGKAQGINFILF
ncbi:hypothetical protein C7Y71_007740 [Pseudoprevotella muciniphila]|uniref:Uncharacterized protein n=1 Tax=Pseudoprevotella muciniphila TaxID=2133944 RepID=A0A5P8E7K0_9BACT|nr:hypothetical protein C7Y71_007740 [Pseudoprevotella muciniphila]